jgi:hypothetical protein
MNSPKISRRILGMMYGTTSRPVGRPQPYDTCIKLKKLDFEGEKGMREWMNVARDRSAW